MSTLADELLQACRDEANAMILIASADMDMDAHLSKHRALLDVAMHAGIAGTLDTLRRLGLLSDEDATS